MIADRWATGNRLAIRGLKSHSQGLNFKKEKREALPKFGDENVVDHMRL